MYKSGSNFDLSGCCFYKQFKIPSRLPSAKHYTIVGDGALDVPQTNNYKTLMAKEETNAAKRDVEGAVPYGF
jgi:hypothetical protein